MTKTLPRCPVEVTLTLIDDRWKVLVIRELLYGTRRFGEIRKAIGKISTKVLTANLRSMEEDGLLTRVVFPEVPPRVEYTLTERGYSLQPVLLSMVEWGRSYKYEMERQTPVRAAGGQILLIGNAGREDLPEILELQYLAYQSEAKLLDDYGIPPLKQSLAEVEAELEEGVILKALDEDNRIVGSVRGKAKDGTLFIGKLMVHPDMQGQGIGTMLLKEIERVCPQSRYELFTSAESRKNIQLYERAGYRVFSEKSVSDRLTFVYLENAKAL